MRNILKVIETFFEKHFPINCHYDRFGGNHRKIASKNSDFPADFRPIAASSSFCFYLKLR